MSGFTSVVESTFCSLSPQTAPARPFSLPSPLPSRAFFLLLFFFSLSQSAASIFAPPVAWETSGRRFKVSRRGSPSWTRLNLRWTSRFLEICQVKSFSRGVRWKLKEDRNWYNIVRVYVRARYTSKMFHVLFARSVHTLTQWYDSKIYRSGRRGAMV